MIYNSIALLLLAGITGGEPLHAVLVKFDGGGGLIRALILALTVGALVVKQAGMWLCLLAPCGSPARQARWWLPAGLVLELLLVLALLHARCWNELRASAHPYTYLPDPSESWWPESMLPRGPRAFTALRLCLLAVWAVQMQSLLFFLRGVARSFRADGLARNINFCLVASLLVFGFGVPVGGSMESQADPEGGPLTCLSYYFLPLFGLTPRAAPAAPPPGLSSLVLYFMLWGMTILVVWCALLVLSVRKAINRAFFPPPPSWSVLGILGWGSVRAGLDLVTVGLVLLIISSSIFLLFLGAAAGEPPHDLLLELDRDGALVRALLLGLPTSGLVLKQAGMWLCLMTPRGSPARRSIWWLPVGLILELVLVLALLQARSWNELQATTWNYKMGPLPATWLPCGPAGFAALRLGLLAVWGLEMLTFLIFLHNLARCLRTDWLARGVLCWIAVSILILGLGLLVGWPMEDTAGPDGGSLACLSFYLLPLFGLIPKPESRLVPAELWASGVVAPGLARPTLCLMLVGATILATGCVILIIFVRKAITRAFRHL
jgi:hypothetical protein